MKTDVNGCSTTAASQEQWEEYYDSFSRTWKIQYDYRTPNGKLFSTVAKNLDIARARRDRWMTMQFYRRGLLSRAEAEALGVQV